MLLQEVIDLCFVKQIFQQRKQRLAYQLWFTVQGWETILSELFDIDHGTPPRMPRRLGALDDRAMSAR